MNRKKLQMRVMSPVILLKSHSWFEGSSGFLFIGRDQMSQHDEKIHLSFLCKSSYKRAPII